MSILPDIVTFYPGTEFAGAGFRANAYLLNLDGFKVLIDPSLRLEEDVDMLLLTHAHYDHIIELPYWHDEKKVKLLCPKRDDYLLHDPVANCSPMFGPARTFSPADYYYGDRETIDLGEDYVFWALNTPGHTHGSSCLFLFKKPENEDFHCDLVDGKLVSNGELILLISGDTIFDDSVGRVDLVTSDVKEMKQSLTILDGILRNLDRELPVMAGHGDVCTLGYLLDHNFYLKAR